MDELRSQRMASSEGHRRSLANSPQEAGSRPEGRLEELVALPSEAHQACFAEKRKERGSTDVDRAVDPLRVIRRFAPFHFRIRTSKGDVGLNSSPYCIPVLSETD